MSTFVIAQKLQFDFPPTVTGNYNADDNHPLIFMDGSGSNLPVVTLPPALNRFGQVFIIKNTTSIATDVDILPFGSDTIEGAASFEMSTAKGCVWLASDGVSNWNIIANY